VNIATTKINRKDGAYMFAFENTQNTQSSLHGVLQQNGNLSLFKEVLPSEQVEKLFYSPKKNNGGKKNE
jgi:hypothetical protein